MTNILNKDEQKQFEFERITDLFSKVDTAYKGVLFSLLITSQLIATYSTWKAISVWILAVFVCYIPRVIIAVQFRHAQKAKQLDVVSITKWEQRFYINSFLPFFSFCSLAFLPFTGDVLAGLMVATLNLFSLLIGGVMLYSASPKVIKLYLLISFGFLITRCLYEGSYPFYILSIFFVGMFFLVRGLIEQQYEIYKDNLVNRIRFQKESLSDPLTGLANRRKLELFMEKFLSVSKRTGQEFQVIMIDIDHFKKYNDTHGHLKGDELLVEMSKLLIKKTRKSDLVARYGGEEFALILTTNNKDSALVLLSKLMTDIEANLGVTISVGLAGSHLADNLEELLELSDKALYQSKQQGRNQVTCA